MTYKRAELRAKTEGFYFWLGAEAEDMHYTWRTGETSEATGRNEQTVGG